MSDFVIIRPYEPGDHDGVYDVCIKTSEAGDPTKPPYRDPEVIPAGFAGAYLELAPELAFVAADGDQVVGYVIGAADSAEFFQRFNAEWLPQVADRFPEVPNPTCGEDWFAYYLHHTDENLREELADYPAHLHINLLDGYRGRGYGRALMEQFYAVLRELNTSGIELSVLKENTGAVAFYERLGFKALDFQPWDDSVKMGIQLG